MKLDENDRATTTRLMKVKDMILKEAIEEKRAADARAKEAFQAQNPWGIFAVPIRVLCRPAYVRAAFFCESSASKLW